MKRNLCFLFVLPLFLAGCVKSTQSMYATDIAELCVKPFFLKSLSNNNLSIETQEEIWDIVQQKITIYFEEQMTEEELEELLQIYGSKKTANVLSKMLSNSLTEEDVEYVNEIYNLSSGFRKFTSEKFQSGLLNVVVEAEKTYRSKNEIRAKYK